MSLQSKVLKSAIKSLKGPLLAVAAVPTAMAAGLIIAAPAIQKMNLEYEREVGKARAMGMNDFNKSASAERTLASKAMESLKQLPKSVATKSSKMAKSALGKDYKKKIGLGAKGLGIAAVAGGATNVGLQLNHERKMDNASAEFVRGVMKKESSLSPGKVLALGAISRF